MKVISIAGFDPTGRAGILRDISVFSSMDLDSIAIPTALTIQTTDKMYDSIPVPLDYIEEVMGRISDSIKGIKIGMLYNDKVVDVVKDFIIDKKPEFTILDPVLKSSSGYPLITDEGIESMKRLIIPLVDFITPNISEGRILTSRVTPVDISNEFHSMGADYVVLTGVDYINDFFSDGNIKMVIKGKPLRFSLHGSGCFYSSYLLGCLILGYKPIEAVKRTKIAVESEAKETNYPGK